MANDEMHTQLPWFSEHDIRSRVSISDAIVAIEKALQNGQDPATDPARTIVDTAHGQLLLMPAESANALGVKIASVAPDNPNRGLPRIQATYLLMDSETMTPLALFEGTALTLLRTSAVSAVAAKHLARIDAANLLLFGAGPQARAHVDAMRAIRPLTSVTIVARTQPKTEALSRYVASLGLDTRVLVAGDLRQVDQAVANAELIVCATTSSTPVFDGRYLPDDACVIAVGSHEPKVREVDGVLVGRSTVVVEDRTTALREAGDIIMAIGEGTLSASSLFSIRDLVNHPNRVRDHSRPSVFKSSGMGWEDLTVAERVYHGGL